MTPKSEFELSQMVADAAGAGLGLSIKGGGTRASLGNPVRGAKKLNMSALRGIELYEPGALTLVARAGTSLAIVEKALADQNQKLPFEPMDHRAILGTTGEPTIGGVVAANVSGPRRIQTGACRDSLIGVRFVDGRGDIIKNGGRVMKNVTGYDLVKLMAGSYGTLGVMTEVAFKVLPASEATASVSISGLGLSEATRAMSKALGSPYDVSGAAHLAHADGPPQTLIRIEGFKASVKYRADKLSKLLSEFGEVDVELNDKKAKAVWADIRDVKALTGRAGDIWKISVAPTDAPMVADLLDAAGIKTDLQCDWGGGLIWAKTPESADVRKALTGIKGYAHLIKGEGPAFHPQTSTLQKIEAGLRAQFDPKGILNPGIMGGRYAN